MNRRTRSPRREILPSSSLPLSRARLPCRVSPNRRARRSSNLERLYVTERKTPTQQGRGGRERGQERSDGKRCHAGWSLARHGIYGGQQRRQEEDLIKFHHAIIAFRETAGAATHQSIRSRATWLGDLAAHSHPLPLSHS
jgi:hypothetical protein